MRFKQFSLRTEFAYWNWIRQFILFHQKRHPRGMGKAEEESSQPFGCNLILVFNSHSGSAVAAGENTAATGICF
jgi:hypothetical protein